MKCKNSWSNKLNINFVVRKLKSIKLNGKQQQQKALSSSTMPAMPNEKTSPIPINETNYSDKKMREQLGCATATQYLSNNRIGHNHQVCGCGNKTAETTTPANNQITNNKYYNNMTNPTMSPNATSTTATTTTPLRSQQSCNRQNFLQNSNSEATTTATTQSSRLNETPAATDGNNQLTATSNTPPPPPPPSSTTPPPTSEPTAPRTPPKKTPKDFIFGKYIGEGSFSNVYLARCIHTHKEFAIKVCEKRHIVKEKKQEYIKREREVMHTMTNVPGFVNLSCTFQDSRRLYFVMTYAKNGDILPYINKVGSFDLHCARHYAAELVLALENMHKRGIVHRDLKPENILLDENMHTLIADFGSAKILNEKEPSMVDLRNIDSGGDCSGGSSSDDATLDELSLQNLRIQQQQQENYYRRRKGSFVGTAQYVSPEVLQNGPISRSADLWALGIIIYQMISGLPPFRGCNDYSIFREILNLNLTFPDGFDENAEDLVRSLLKLNAEERIGAQDKTGRYESIRTHPFFDGINWETIRSQTPPPIYPYLPGVSNEDEFSSHYRVPDNLEPGLDDRQLTRLLGFELGTSIGDFQIEQKTVPNNNFNLSEKEKMKFLEKQKADKWHAFADNEIILKKGFVNKRKGLFARKRMLLLTTGPRLIYIDPVQMVKKGEIPWSPELRVEPRNFKIFFVHTPNRTYYLEDPEGFALQWFEAIENVRHQTYGDDL